MTLQYYYGSLPTIINLSFFFLRAPLTLEDSKLFLSVIVIVADSSKRHSLLISPFLQTFFFIGMEKIMPDSKNAINEWVCSQVTQSIEDIFDPSK